MNVSDNDSVSQRDRKPQITLRALFGLTLVIAFVLSLYRCNQRVKRWQQETFQLREKLRAADWQIEFRDDPKKPESGSKGRGFLSKVNLEGQDFRGVSITVGSSAFQKTWLVGANLQKTTIAAGGASFQFVRLDHANLQGANLSAGGSSFQLASFLGADLRGATLTGGGASFQGSSMREADLTGATIICPPNLSAFQGVDISSANFQGADISAVQALNLQSCYFSTPPKYDAKTKFAKDFDPVAADWELVP